MAAKATEFLRSGGEALALRRQIEAVVGHPLFGRLGTVSAVRVFMEHHVWCVWDFMSLAKAIQSSLATPLPWTPSPHPQALADINEILASEETDLGPDGVRRSHFEEFLHAMKAAGANVAAAEAFIHDLRQGFDPITSMRRQGAPEAATDFVSVTLRHAAGAPHIRAAAFCIGREELVPHMLMKLRDALPWQQPELHRFRWYVDRHIEIDIRSHGPSSRAILHAVLGVAPHNMAEAADAAFEAVSARVKFLDEIAKHV